MKVVGVGAGGHARVVIEALRAMGGFEVVGLLDARPELWGTNALGVPVLGGDDRLPALREQGVLYAFNGVGSVGRTAARRQVYEMLRRQGFEPVPVIHPSAILSPSISLGQAPIILPGAIIGTGARIGDNVLINTGAIVEHDCRIGDHAHVATGARLAGGVLVGDGAHIGLGACIRQGIRVGRNAIVGMGAVVTKDVPDDVTVIGVPARIVEGTER